MGLDGVAGGQQRRWWVLAILTLAQLMVVVDVTIVNIALPAAQADLGFADDGRHWLVTGYALAFGSLLLIGGRLSDFFGQRRMLVVGLVGFALASGLGGFAQSFDTLLAARLLQGAFGAALAPAALSLVSMTFEDRASRLRAFAVFGGASSAGGAVGLLLGGVLTELLSWRWCMFVNLPISVIALAGVWLIRKQPILTRNRLDLPGAVTSTGGIISLVYGLANAEHEGWGALWTIAPVLFGLALLSAFVLIERRSTHPLLPMRVIVHRNRGAANLVGVMVNGGLFGVFLFSTFYFTDVLQFTPVQTGLSFVPVVLGIMVTTALVGSPIAARFGRRSVITLGCLVAGGGLALQTGASTDSRFASDTLPGLVLYGLGLGLVFGRLQEAATAHTEARDTGVASALINASQEVGGSIGTALASSVAATATAALLATAVDPVSTASLTAVSYQSALWVAVSLYAMAAIVAATVFRPLQPQPDTTDTAPPVRH
ncbi:MFS transporter [Cellulosimicrobium cellulans]|uniref:MFS transporter n=1 Tax=Cellulosimicrobium cellulans TaxID=1710 RepID=UPI0036EB51FA